MANYTFYVDIPDVGGAARPKTAIYLPPAYGDGTTLNMLIYLHGINARPIDLYLMEANHFLREKVKSSGKNVVFVAPTLTDQKGSKCNGAKMESEPDWYIDKIRDAIKDREGSVAALNNLIVACHSGGGRPVVQVVKNLNKYKTSLQEVWGFDCLYGPQGDPGVPWDGKSNQTRPNAQSQEMIWAMTMPRSYVYYWDSEPAIRSKNLELLAKENPSIVVTVTRSSATAHDRVPLTHLEDRIKSSTAL